MVEQQMENILQNLTTKRFEYTPNPIESYDQFIKRKSQVIQAWHDKNIGKALEGIKLFADTANDNERVRDLPNKLSTLEQTLEKECEGKDVKAFVKHFNEHNIFGLIEEDFNYLLELATKMENDGKIHEACCMYRALTVLFPAKIDGWLNWGSMELEHFFDYNAILLIYEECLLIFDDPFVYYCIACCHIKGNEINLAKDSLEKTIKRSIEINDIETREKAEKMLAALG